MEGGDWLTSGRDSTVSQCWSINLLLRVELEVYSVLV